MNRSTYWTWVISLLVFLFVAAGAGAANGAPNGYFTFLDVIGLITMLAVGAERMDDAGKSRWWALFAPMVLGTIIIGCLKSAPKTEEVSC